MKYLIILFLFSMTLSTVSCKKEAINNPDPVAKDTPVLLTKVFYTDTTLSAPYDTMGRYFFQYDDQYRLSEMRFEDWMNAGQIFYSIVSRPVYNGLDSLPTKIYYVLTTYPSSGVSQIYYDTMNFTYQGNQRIKDSAHGEQILYNRTYTYSGNNITIQESYPGSPTSSMYSSHNLTFSNGNLIRQQDSIVNVSASTIITEWYDYQFQFNSHPDPLYRALRHICRPVVDEDGWTYFSYQRFVNPNLMDHYHYDRDWISVGGTGGSGTDYNDITYQYQFRPDGYPLIQYQSMPNGTSFSYFKQVYVYNK